MYVGQYDSVSGGGDRYSTFVITMIIGMPRLLISTFSPRGSIGSESSVLPGVPAEGAVNLDVELSGSTYS